MKVILEMILEHFCSFYYVAVFIMIYKQLQTVGSV